MPEIPISDALLNKRKSELSGLQQAIKKALKEQDPEEYRRRYPEEFPTGQNEMTPAKGILLPPELLPKPERIQWETQVTVNEGFTSARLLMLVFAFLVGIPIAAVLIITETLFPGAIVLLIVFWIIYSAGILQGKVTRKTRRTKGWG